jgi:hypothetical protein
MCQVFALFNARSGFSFFLQFFYVWLETGKVYLLYLTLHLVCFYILSFLILQLDFLTGFLFSVRGTPEFPRNPTWETLTK